MTNIRAINVNAGLAAIAIFAVLVTGCGQDSGYTEPLPFDSDQWRRGDALGMTDQDAPRLRMADGLVADRVLLGKSKLQIEEMLGPPTDTDKFSEHGLVYWLGPERSFMSIDSEWLVIDFDARGNSVKAYLVRD